MSDNKLFWKTVKPFFSNKRSHRGNIKLSEGDKLLQDDSEVAEELNKFFKKAVSTLDVNENSYIINPDSINISDTIEKVTSKYKFDPSILLINDKIVSREKFSFKVISKLDMGKQVKLINPKNASTSDRIPPKISKISSDVSADALHSLFNDMLKTGSFPENLKLANITLVFKKKNPLHKVNYRPVSVLPSISKIFEKLMI